jgi:hypothetical protein
MQKKDPKYYDLKEETAWTMEQFKYYTILFYFYFLFYLFFSDYINKNVAPNKNIEKDWILTTLPVSFIFNLK